MNILIVDDKEENLYLLEALLSGSGYEVVSAKNGVEALEKLKKDSFNMIISDILMPKMDGYQLCRECKSDDKLKKIPFIFSTATYTDKKDEEFALSLGADKFTVKPLEPNLFLDIVKSVIKEGVKKPRLAPKKPIEEETVYFEEYNKRLIKKLEKKRLDLEKEVNERKKAEEKVKEQNKFLKDVMCALTHPFAVIDANNYRIIFGNAVTGWSDNLKELKCYELTHKREKPCSGKEYPCPLKKVIETKMPTVVEHTHHDKDGNMRNVEIHAYPILDGKGSVVQVIEYSIDITERKKAEEEVRKLSLAVEQSPAATVISDTKGNIEYVNPKFTEITGYTYEEIIGKNFRILNSGEHPPDFYKELWDTITSGKEWHGEFHHKKKNGEFYWEHASISPIKNEEGVITHFLGVKEDITETKLMEEQLLQSQKMEAVGSLAGGVAHDFNNMMTVVIGYSEFLLSTLKKGEVEYKCVGEIMKAGKKAASLTQQLLAFSRKQVFQPHVVNLNALITDLEKMLKRLIGEDIDLQLDLDSKLGAVRADPGQMDQITMNLAVNARDAMPRGGKITIETANVELDEEYCRLHMAVQPGAYIMLAVSDTGIGMDKETQSRIFEPFFSTKEEGKGTGLGLSTVYGIVKQSFGNIWVYTEPGHGTTFKIYFPRIEEATEAREKEEASEKIFRGSETILLVEDEEMVRDLAYKVLAEMGYTVLAASNGEEALQICERHKGPIHLMLTDVVMPKMSGKELAESSVRRHPELKVLYMSGYTDNSVIRNGMLEPGVNFVQKPFTPLSLTKKVREVLDASESQKG